MDWTLLAIAPTQDKKAITAAYRARLAHVNPEEKPEEFKALRAAYEEALLLAQQPQTAPQREDPVDQWMAEVRAVYGDFPRRLSPAVWQELLAQDVCTALDTRPAAEEALLRFLTEDFYLPQAIWQVLDEVFRWQERRSELYESFPRDFVDYAVINGIRYGENLPYALFDPGLNARDCDDYRRIYYRASQSDAAELPALLEQLAALSEAHPYGELLSYQLMLQQGNAEEALAGYRHLAQSYPQDVKLQLEWAAQCISGENWAEGEVYARRALELRPDAAQASQMLADCLAARGEYEEAKQLLFRLMDAAGGDQKRIYELRQIIQTWNRELIARQEAQLQETPDDDGLRARLAWCYLQNDRTDDALALCRAIGADYGDPYDYHNLCAKASYAMELYEQALPHLQQLEQLLRSMEPDGTEKTAERIHSLPEKLQMQGSCHLLLGRRSEALEKYEQAVALAPDNPEVLTHMGRLLSQLGDNERAAQAFEQVTHLLPGAYHGHYLLSQSLFDLGRDRDAFDAVNRALELEGCDLGVYLLKMRILLRNGVWNAVRETLDFLRQHGITDEINVVWCEAQLLEYGEKNKEQALALYRTLAQRVEGGEPLNEASTLYFRLLVLEAEHLDARKAEDRAKMLAIADAGLRHRENDFPLLDYKAWLLKRDGRKEEALAIYHRLEQVPRRNMGVEEELAELYYATLDTTADKALYYYEKLLQQEENATHLFYAGTCRRYLGDYEGARRDLLRVQELEPDGIDGYNGLSYLCDWMGRYEESLSYVDQVLAKVKSWEGDQSKYFYHKVRILRRLNRPQEALAVIDELTEKYGNDDVFREKFDICCQFALWDQAEAILNEWHKSGQKKNRLAAARMDLDLFTGRLDAARTALQRPDRLNKSDAQRLQLLMAELDGDEAAQMDIWNARLEGRSDTTHELMNMAQVQWWNGHYDKAREYAQAALTQLEDLIPRRRKQEALYRSRRSIVLALLGRIDEARAELAAVRQLPLCEGCDYCTCKDADIFEANMEEICGHWEQALALHRAGAERWHDDLDFVSGMRRMMRKGYSHDDRH